MTIVFNRPFLTEQCLEYIKQTLTAGHWAGDGGFTKKSQLWLEKNLGCHKTLLVHSCTAALEMAALLLDTQAGDEIIMPSYTFVSTANSFVLRGAVPVFVDIRADTQNINEGLIEAAITKKTKAICVVHYAGVGCEMDTILAIAKKHNLAVVEDAAQGLMASYNQKPLGALGGLGAVSFHETKNIASGEGGALVINDPRFTERAEIIREKGTDRSQFYRGMVDKYTWRDVGSSFLLSDILAAVLYSQLQEAKNITAMRLAIWQKYHDAFAGLEGQGRLRRPVVPSQCQHNAHLYYVLLAEDIDRGRVIEKMKAAGIQTAFHYLPLHSSPAGKKYGRVSGDMTNTDRAGQYLLRLPLWTGMTAEQQVSVIDVFCASLAR